VLAATSTPLVDNKPDKADRSRALAPTPAAAPSGHPNKSQCIAAHEGAQAARTSRKLLDARTGFVTCSHEACPEMIRDDCSKGLREVDEALPTVVLSATVDGKDTTDVSAILDGAPVEGTLDGRAVPIDPGPHVARFERPGSGAVEVRVVVREGEKNRLVTGVFVVSGGRGPGTTGGLTNAGQFDKQDKPDKLALYVPIALAATGVLALGAALFIHVDMTGDASDLHDACAPRCPQADRDALSDQLVLRNVALGIGLGALAVAAVTYVVGLRK
jgi:hypothetical protein